MSRRPVVPLSFTRHGDASRPAVILLQGLGMASNAWPAELVDALVETGLQVVLPDNRDAGKSPRVTGVRVRDVEVLGAVARTLARRKVSAAYDLDDMADDVVALADGLGIGRFHVAGFSMGGMIAQTLALRHPERILSLASLSSATGNPATGLGRLGTIWKIIRPRGPARTKEEAREEMREILLALSGPAFRGVSSMRSSGCSTASRTRRSTWRRRSGSCLRSSRAETGRRRSGRFGFRRLSFTARRIRCCRSRRVKRRRP